MSENGLETFKVEGPQESGSDIFFTQNTEDEEIGDEILNDNKIEMIKVDVDSFDENDDQINSKQTDQMNSSLNNTRVPLEIRQQIVGKFVSPL